MENRRIRDDSGLIEGCILKDAAAWDALIKKYSGLVMDAAYNRARKYGVSLPRHDIEDIAQGVFTAIWSSGKLLTVRNRSDISCWLAVVSGNAAVEHLKARSGTEPLDEEEVACAGAPPDDDILEEIDRAMEGLPPKERLMIELHLIHDKKYREIADMLDIPEGTVSSYIKRARTRLKKKLRFLQ